MGTDLLVRDCQVFDGEQVVAADSVLVRDGLIAAVGTGLACSPSGEVVQADGMTLLPGLIDCHVHAFPGGLEQPLAFGVTTQLDMFNVPGVVAELRAEAAGRPDVADLRSALVGATAPGGHPARLMASVGAPPFPAVRGPDDAADFVARQAADGADYIKLIIEDGGCFGLSMPTLAPDTVRAVVEAAHQHGFLAVAHAMSKAAAEQAIESGADGLGHLFIDRAPDAAFAQKVARAGMFAVPTLSVLEVATGNPGSARLADDPRLAPYLAPVWRAFLAMGDNAFLGQPDPPPRAEHAIAATGLLHRAGVPILAGTDAPLRTAYGLSMHRELELLVTAGLSPVEALSAATALPARCFHLTDRGRIAVGLRADLLLVNGNPTADITRTRAIAAVWRAGTRLDRDAYRDRLRATE